MNEMNEITRTFEIGRLIQKWNSACSTHHDEYYGEIATNAFNGEYDCTAEANECTDFDKLTEIWKLVGCTVLAPKVFLKEVQRIIYK